MKNLINTVIVLIFSFPIANACSCFYEAMSVKKINSYDLVFKGKIVNKEKVDELPTKGKKNLNNAFKMEYFKYTFEVQEQIKLFTKAKQVTVYSSRSGASCGVNYAVGDAFYIFSYDNKGVYMTGLCANNTRVENADKSYKKIVEQYKNPKQRNVWKDDKCQKVADGKFADGKPDGLWIYYNKDGSIQSKGHYKNGMKDGLWLSYLDEEGSAEYIELLSDAQKLKIADVKNIIDSQSMFKDGKRLKMTNRFVLGGN